MVTPGPAEPLQPPAEWGQNRGCHRAAATAWGAVLGFGCSNPEGTQRGACGMRGGGGRCRWGRGNGQNWGVGCTGAVGHSQLLTCSGFVCLK